jgi:hypothetical protein
MFQLQEWDPPFWSSYLQGRYRESGSKKVLSSLRSFTIGFWTWNEDSNLQTNIGPSKREAGIKGAEVGVESPLLLLYLAQVRFHIPSWCWTGDVASRRGGLNL